MGLLCTKALNRELFRETFGTKQDEEFALYNTIPMQHVHDWNNGRSEGPDPNKLQFDMTANHRSPWNTVVIEHLTKLLEQKSNEAEYLPERPKTYFKAMVVEKFKRCQRIWKKSRPVTDSHGFLELSTQLEKQMNEAKALQMKSSRQATRRRSVSPNHPGLIVCSFVTEMDEANSNCRLYGEVQGHRRPSNLEVALE